MESSEPAQHETATPGQRLREARENAGISPREMADRLNWGVAHVTAIEEDRYETLRNAAFVRGYLRAYGRELGLDCDELVDSFDALSGGSAADSDAIVASNRSASSQSTGLSVVVGITIALLVAGGVWWQSQKDPDSAPASAVVNETPTGKPEVTSSPASPGPAERVVNPAAESSSGVEPTPRTAAASDPAVIEPAESASTEPGLAMEAGPATDESLPPAADEETGGGDAAPGVVLEPSVTESEQASIDYAENEREAEPEAPVNPEPEPAALEFQFSGDCWLEVRDGDGELIFADLRADGDTVRLDGTAPFDILAGNAGALRLTYLGEPVDIQTRPGRNIARFTVGEP